MRKKGKKDWKFQYVCFQLIFLFSSLDLTTGLHCLNVPKSRVSQFQCSGKKKTFSLLSGRNRKWVVAVEGGGVDLDVHRL